MLACALAGVRDGLLTKGSIFRRVGGVVDGRT